MRRGRVRGGYTLVELIAGLVVMSLAVSAVAPVLGVLSQGAAETSLERDSIAAVRNGLVRACEIVREAAAADAAASGVASAGAQELELSNGDRVFLRDGSLRAETGGTEWVLIPDGVDRFEIGLWSADGETSAVPAESWRLTLTVGRGDLALASAVMLRGEPALWRREAGL